MDILTTRTTQETVAMRVIASVSVLVTIFFLPGSFISVSRSIEYMMLLIQQQSLMNTDIVSYPRRQRWYQQWNGLYWRHHDVLSSHTPAHGCDAPRLVPYLLVCGSKGKG